LKSAIDGITVVHILKSHVKELLDTIEEFTNRSTRLVTYISWDNGELLELISKRLKYSSLLWQDVFAISESDFTEIVAPRLRNGPRDLLRYIDIILQRKSLGQKISKTDFDDVADDYRQLAYQQMQVVYGDVFSNVGEFVRELFKDSESLDLNHGQTEYEKMRLESRPNASIYSQRSFSNFQRALVSITDSGCVDINDGNKWVQPYQKEYFEAISKKTRSETQAKLCNTPNEIIPSLSPAELRALCEVTSPASSSPSRPSAGLRRRPSCAGPCLGQSASEALSRAGWRRGRICARRRKRRRSPRCPSGAPADRRRPRAQLIAGA
jgi:hypothetical protein